MNLLHIFLHLEVNFYIHNVTYNVHHVNVTLQINFKFGLNRIHNKKETYVFTFTNHDIVELYIVNPLVFCEKVRIMRASSRLICK